MVYQPVPWIGFYGSYTKSFGFNNGISTAGTPFPPEIAEGWEGGVKTELLDRRLTATLAFFDVTISNILTSVPTPEDPFAARPIGLVRSQGAELDALGKLTNELSVIASYAHIDAKVIVDNSGLLGKSANSFAPDSGSLSSPGISGGQPVARLARRRRRRRREQPVGRRQKHPYPARLCPP